MKLFICLVIAFLNVKYFVEFAFGSYHMVLIFISIFCIKMAIYKL